MAIGRSISSRSRTENTTSPHLRFTFVGSENTPANTQNTYFSRRSVSHLAPSIVSRTEWRSFMSGISFHSALSSSIVIPLSEYVVMRAFSSIASSVGVISQSMRRTSPIMFTIAVLRRSPGCDSVSLSQRGRSNGLIFSLEFRLILRYVQPTVSTSARYSFSGSRTITSVHIMRERSISSFTANDFPQPDFAKTHIFAFSDENLSKIIRELLCVLIP